ncbi:MAG: hypothetical protein DMG41_18195 [Acidobacteria bacterium]|nr:MAG: hypothetical protein AUH13_26490 [Acidobacteria bacterium 13_2_20CM_58_27]PYT64988.1 MAG: hypothetical protein DMG42_33310 [Acidobacteriota bacterium]PYT86840.1 MAG: hypothetical protein DMG41_18195 [Acidobacteriota bacterium]
MRQRTRSLLVVAVGFALLSLSEAGCEDKRVTNLEQRVKQLEDRTRQLGAERTKSTNDDDVRRLKLENCVADANADFQRNLENNGTKARNGSYNVPVPLLEQMQRQKQSKIEECKILYSK